jgi:hypothetical protein
MVLYEYERNKPKGGAQDVQSIPILARDLQLHVGPVPTSQRLNISYNVPKRSAVKISLYDVTGRLIVVLVCGLQEAGEYNRMINTNTLTPGVYFMRLEASDKVVVKKVIVLK